MTRIVAGAARGRRLAVPPGLATRPTSEKVRAAIFDLLGQYFDGGEVLDLYAGSGALALEALSRGASRAICVEVDRRAAEVIRGNAAALGLADRLEVRCGPVAALLPGLPAGHALAFVDPPYAIGPAEALGALEGHLVPGGVVVAEHDARRPPADRYGALALLDRRRYGDTGISIYRRG